MEQFEIPDLVKPCHLKFENSQKQWESGLWCRVICILVYFTRLSDCMTVGFGQHLPFVFVEIISIYDSRKTHKVHSERATGLFIQIVGLFVRGELERTYEKPSWSNKCKIPGFIWMVWGKIWELVVRRIDDRSEVLNQHCLKKFYSIPLQIIGSKITYKALGFPKGSVPICHTLRSHVWRDRCFIQIVSVRQM